MIGFLLCLVVIVIIVILAIALGAIFNYANNCPTAESLLSGDSEIPDGMTRKDMTGKIIIVTGSNAGIGKECVRVLALTNATIVMACRNLKKANEAARVISKSTCNEKIHVMKCDLADLRSVDEFVKSFNAKFTQLHTLICNAGIWPMRAGLKTVDGFELANGVNHLGHMHLSLSLKAMMEKTCQDEKKRTSNANSSSLDDDFYRPRVLVVASEAHRIGSLKVPSFLPSSIKKLCENQIGCAGLNSKTFLKRLIAKPGDENGYTFTSAYNASKMANCLFAKEWARAMQTQVMCVSLHPGVSARTELMSGDHHEKTSLFSFIAGLGKKLDGFFHVSNEMGELAFTQTYLTLTRDADKCLANGAYFCGAMDYSHIQPKLAHDKQVARDLWNVSLKMIQGALTS